MSSARGDPVRSPMTAPRIAVGKSICRVRGGPDAVDIVRGPTAIGVWGLPLESSPAIESIDANSGSDVAIGASANDRFLHAEHDTPRCPRPVLSWRHESRSPAAVLTARAKGASSTSSSFRARCRAPNAGSQPMALCDNTIGQCSVAKEAHARCSDASPSTWTLCVRGC